MKRHYLDAPENINQEEFKKLPNRDNFSGFYFGATGSGYTKPSSFKRKLSKNELKLVAKVKKYYFIVGLLIPLPFLLGKLIYDFLTNNLHISHMSISQPEVYFAFVVLIGFFVIVYKKVSDILARAGFSLFFFSLFILVCLLMVAPTLYLLCNLFDSWIYRELSFYIATTVASIIISRILFMPVISKTVKISKDIILIFILVFCFAIGSLYLLI